MRTVRFSTLFLICLTTAVMTTDSRAFAKSPSGEKKEVVIPADQMEFKEVVPGVSRAVLWGNPEKGPYGALTKFKAGTNHALHTHANDIHIVVVSGAYIYQTDAGTTRVGPGSYMLVPAHKPHLSGAEQDTLFVEQSSGKFDLTFVKEKKK